MSPSLVLVTALRCCCKVLANTVTTELLVTKMTTGNHKNWTLDWTCELDCGLIVGPSFGLTYVLDVTRCQCLKLAKVIS